MRLGRGEQGSVRRGSNVGLVGGQLCRAARGMKIASENRRTEASPVIGGKPLPGGLAG